MFSVSKQKFMDAIYLEILVPPSSNKFWKSLIERKSEYTNTKKKFATIQTFRLLLIS